MNKVDRCITPPTIYIKISKLTATIDLAALSSGVTEVESTNNVMATLRRIFAVSKRSIREELEKISERTNLRIRLESFSMSPQKRVSEESVEGQ